MRTVGRGKSESGWYETKRFPERVQRVFRSMRRGEMSGFHEGREVWPSHETWGSHAIDGSRRLIFEVPG